jgi:predicted PurR-regulated permease PerM
VTADGDTAGRNPPLRPTPAAPVAPVVGPNRSDAASSPAQVIARALLYLAVTGLAVLFVWLTIKVDLVIFAGILLAICLRRCADGVSRLTRLPHGWALAVVLLLIVLSIAAIGWFFSQAITSQIAALSQQLPAAAEKVSKAFGQSALGKALTQHIGQFQTSATTMVNSFFGIATNVAEVVGGIAIIIFLGIYFAAEGRRYARGALRLAPVARRPRLREIQDETASAVWYWMLGRLFSMTVLGVLTALGLWLLGIPLPIALGFLTAIMTFVPYIGSIVSAIPAVLIAGSINIGLAIYVIVLYVGVHVVEGYILVPLVQRRVVHLPPGLTLSAQIVLGVLAGFLGLLLATPLVAAALVIIRMAYIEDVLGDRSADAPFE